GLRGSSMSLIRINASMGMVLSLAIAFTLTPWLARLWLKKPNTEEKPKESKLPTVLQGFSSKLFAPFLHPEKGNKNRFFLGLGVMGLIGFSVLLPATGLVILKMLPFDNKSELQVVVDMPAGTPLEETATVLAELCDYLATVPEV